jgi:YHS domain-containing protein
MTAQRRDLNGWSRGIALIALLAVSAPALCRAATSERVVTDRYTGLAIGGFDPVAFFTDAKPLVGRPDFELSVEGTVWRFVNEGNRSAFVDNPAVYMPRFGGYDPVAIARGTSVPGHPLFWSVTAGRLYLFYNEAARTAFNGDPGRYIETAERRWPDVARTLGQ